MAFQPAFQRDRYLPFRKWTLSLYGDAVPTGARVLNYRQLDRIRSFLHDASSHELPLRLLRAELSRSVSRIDVRRLTDDEVIEDLARRVACGEYCLLEHPMPQPSVVRFELEEEIAPIAPAAEPELPPESEPVMDDNAQVTALLEAAKLGTPFCEECARARAA